MRHILLSIALAACGGSDSEPFDYECGDIVCEGSTEACWLPNCGASEDSEYQCKPIDESNPDCSYDGRGYTCAFTCG